MNAERIYLLISLFLLFDLLFCQRYFRRHVHKVGRASRRRDVCSRSCVECALHCAQLLDCNSFNFPCGSPKVHCTNFTKNCGLLIGNMDEMVTMELIDNCHYTKLPRVYAASAVAWDFCRDGSSLDYVVVTEAGTYIYDDISELIGGRPCQKLLSLERIFSGFPDLPATGDIDSIALDDWSTMMLYSGGSVWAWEATARSLRPKVGYPKTMESLYGGKITAFPKWVTSRYHRRLERHFFDERLYIHVTYPGLDDVIVNVTLQQEARDDVGFDQNPWHTLPPGVVAVAQIGVGSNKYAMFTENNVVYVLDIMYSINPSSPHLVLTKHGSMDFA